MGKAKKGRKKDTKARPPKENPYHQTLVQCLADAKNDRANIKAQLAMCKVVQRIAERDEDWIPPYNNWELELPISVLLATKKHPNHSALRECACLALCALLYTDCFYCILEDIGGAKFFAEMIEENLENEMIHKAILEPLNRQYDNGPNNVRYSTHNILVEAGFYEAVIKSVKAHPTSSDIPTLAKGIITSMFEMINLHLSVQDHDDLEDCPNTTCVQDIIGFLLAGVDESQTDQFHAKNCCDILSEVLTIEYSESTIHLVKKAGGTRKVLAMMKRHPRNHALQGSACLVLAYAEDNSLDLRSNCIRAVETFLESFWEYAHARKNGMLFFLTNVVVADVQPSGLLVLKSGFVTFLLGLMKKYKESEVQHLGCRILGSLNYGVEANGLVTDEEAAHLVSQAVNKAEKFDFSLLHDSVLAIEALITKGDTEVILDAFLKEDCYPNLVKAIEADRRQPWLRRIEHKKDRWVFSDRHKKDRWVFTILLEIASSKRNDIKLELATSGGIDLIIDCMKESADDEEIQSCACKTLGLITMNKDPQIFEAISKADGVNIILDAIEKFPKEQVIFNFGGSAALRTREYEDEMKYGKLEC